MSWFLRKKKRSRRRTGGLIKAAKEQRWDAQRTWFRLQAVGVALAFTGLGGGWYFGKQQLEQYVRAHETSVHAELVELQALPLWVSPVLQARLQQEVSQLFANSDPLNANGPEAVAQLMNENPWVAAVERVERVSGGTVKIHALYRRPAAAVRMNDESYLLVDGTGVLLPVQYSAHEIEQVYLPRLLGVKSRRPSVGESWATDDLRAGLSVIRLLSEEPYAPQIQAVDVAERDARGRVRVALLTDGGKVYWGLPPEEEGALEISTETKLLRLASLYEQYGRIDAGAKTVSVYGARIFALAPSTGIQRPVEAGYSW